jgi:hypothetical protein
MGSCLKSKKGDGLITKYGFEPGQKNFEIRGANQDQISKAKDIVRAALIVLPVDVVAKKVGVAFVGKLTQTGAAQDMKPIMKKLIEYIRLFPADIVTEGLNVLDNDPRYGWLPSWPAMKEIFDNLMLDRQKIVDAIRNANCESTDRKTYGMINAFGRDYSPGDPASDKLDKAATELINRLKGK